ncbi:hypothetical protein ACFVTE_09605 [Arthrobacter sp. NPDC058097]
MAACPCGANTDGSDPELKTFIGSVGGDPNAAPQITVGQAIDSPDKF